MDWPPQSTGLNITYTEKEIKDSLSLKKNSGKCRGKPGIIYQKITKENFKTVFPKEFKMYKGRAH